MELTWTRTSPGHYTSADHRWSIAKDDGLWFVYDGTILANWRETLTDAKALASKLAK